MKFLHIVLIILIQSATVFADTGIVIVSKSTDLSNQKVTTSKMYLNDTHLSIQNSGADNSSLIFDASKQIFTFIDHSKREYYQFDEPTLQQLKDQLRMMVQMMKQFSSQMPKEQQEKLDQLLSPKNNALVEYKNNGNTKVSSWNTTLYTGISANKKVIETNIASYQELGILESKFHVLNSLMTFFKENLEEVASLLPTPQSLQAIKIDENSPILEKGLPVKTITFNEKGVASSNSLVQSISESEINPSLFRIPSGYSRKTINLQQQFQR
ncbi:hypothetical protein [Reichenbachiella ulvae]|uniref:DUF4412 domain-containing protein n=1 Tax=Reichenbachiella ulvae TaxID=2980104 RepID=A0ABT3CZX7_9BACT|nr:hypothetical protein [Reichenbachiella ulvae]MCV9389246.1 hypothetical protein [Reichenbachiella ulvae]